MDIFLLFVIYYCFMNVWLFALMGADKRKSKRQAWRIKEKTLWLMIILGGASGGWLGMNTFRHKTNHKAFKLALPAVALIHLCALVYGGVKFYL